MILLTDRAERGRSWIFLVFGIGLIGSAVVRRLETLQDLERETLPLDWQDSDSQARQLADLERDVEARITELLVAGPEGAPPRLAVLWSAGRAGFQASAEAIGRELSTFRRVLDGVARVAERHPETKVSFAATSSAGGLFEGQRAVDAMSLPSPRRPYGELKLAQEVLLAEMATRFACRVYRPSSVYGFLAGPRRRGLIPTLILNALRHDVTRITGSFNTLRDYVWVEDVAARIAADLLTADAPSWEVSILASTKPSSIFEILHLTERVMARPLYVTLAGDTSNSADITFARGSVPSGWRTTPLETTIRRIHSHALRTGAAYGGLAD